MLLHRVWQRGDTLQLTGQGDSTSSLLCLPPCSCWMGRQCHPETLPVSPGNSRCRGTGSTTSLNNCNEPWWLKIAILILAQQSKSCTEYIAENNFFFLHSFQYLFFFQFCLVLFLGWFYCPARTLGEQRRWGFFSHCLTGLSSPKPFSSRFALLPCLPLGDQFSSTVWVMCWIQT